MSIYKYSVKDNQDNDIHLETYKGKVLLIVNTATSCGLTPQYSKLQEVYDKFKDKNFEILDFPCNQFMNQAKGSDEEIEKFCTLNYKTTFKRFKKIDVNGENESPLYTFLKSKKDGIFNNSIKWNFTKFLVDTNGHVVERYSPTTLPEDIIYDIEKLLKV